MDQFDEKITEQNANVAPLLERAFMFLEDGDWNSADKYCERVLDIDPKCADAYLGKLMAELRVNKREKLKDCMFPFDRSSNYQKAIRFANDGLKAEMTGYIAHINMRNENMQLEGIYIQAKNAVAAASTEKAFKAAAKIFETIPKYKDAATLSKECYEKAEIARKEAGKRANCIKKIAIVTSLAICAIVAFVIVLNTVIIPPVKYNDAVALMDAGKIGEAAITFGKIGSYKDAKEQSGALWNQIAVRDTISAGAYHTVGLKADGTVVAVGDNSDGQCNVSGLKNIVAVSAGSGYTVGLRADGTVVAVGRNTVGACDVSDWTDIVAISAGYYHTVGLKVDGTVVATKIIGERGPVCDSGQCDVSDWTDIVAISAGEEYTVGLRADGTVVATEIIGAWSALNDRGQCNVSEWTDIVAISAEDGHTVGLKADGTVVATRYTGPSEFNNGQCYVSGWRDIVAISAGVSHTVGLKADGTVVAVGSKYHGRCDVSGWRNIKTK